MSYDIHDTTFKKLMSQPECVIDFYKVYLQNRLNMEIDSKTLSLYKLNGEYVSMKKHPEKLIREKHIADLVYQFQFKDKAGSDGFLLFHCEHQSRPAKDMPLRMLKYATSILSEYHKTHPKSLFPTFIPVVYYHGSRPYPYSMNIYDLFKEPEVASQYLLNPILIDLTQQTDKDLRKHGSIASGEIALKHVFDQRITEGTIDHFIRAIAENEAAKGDGDITKVVVEYCIDAWKYQDSVLLDKIAKSIPTLRGDIMTIAQRLREEGIEQGRELGKNDTSLNIAKNLLISCVDIELIASTTGLNMLEVQKLAVDTGIAID